jgi:hypothetical protein
VASLGVGISEGLIFESVRVDDQEIGRTAKIRVDFRLQVRALGGHADLPLDVRSWLNPSGRLFMTAGSLMMMPVIAQILPGFEFSPEKPLDHFIQLSLDSDDSLDILFTEKPLGAGPHPSGDYDIHAPLRKIEGKKPGLMSRIGDFRALNDPPLFDFNKSIGRAAAEMSGDRPAVCRNGYLHRYLLCILME